MSKETMWWIIGGVIAILVLVAAWWLFTGKPTDSSAHATTTQQGNNSDNGSPSSSGGNGSATVAVNMGEEVTVDDQPAGDRVVVADAKISRVSWIAVRDSMRIYGAKRVNPVGNGQTFTDVVVPLLRNTEAGKTYSVVVFADDGDGAFDFKKDALVDGLDDTFTALNGD